MQPNNSYRENFTIEPKMSPTKNQSELKRNSITSAYSFEPPRFKSVPDSAPIQSSKKVITLILPWCC